MKIVEINGGAAGSTGKIMFGIADLARKSGIQTLCASPITSTNRDNRIKEKYVKIGSYNSRRLNVLLSYLTGYNGCFALLETKKMLNEIKQFSPDIIHLHNLHNSFINLPMLFSYIKKNHIRTIWTLHDCWSFTGHCPHFTMEKCDKWKAGCYDCPSYKDYPQSMFDNSKKMYKLKKKLFTGVQNMTIVTPSQWLANLVKQSYLKDYTVKVINNGIDLSVFKPSKSDFRDKHGIKENEYMLLGVAFGWDVKKGFDVFLELANRFPKNYKIVLVGTDDNTDKQLSDNIISIRRTQNQAELAEIYSAADLFVNPTREENYPTVNIEAIACGTPILTFCTGGSPEIIDEVCGTVIECDDIDSMEHKIKDICENERFVRSACVEHAKKFDMNEKFLEYIDLYNLINQDK